MDLLDSDIVKPATISAIIITNIVLNSTVIAVILRYPQLREDRTTLFMFSLTLSDLASGCTTMPISAAVCSKATPQVRYLVPVLPMVQEICSSWFAFVSLHSLCWVTVCKMVAITKPLRYEQLLTRNRCYAIIIVTWFIGALFAISMSYLAVGWGMDSCFFDSKNSSTSTRHNEITESAFVIGFIIFGWALPVSAILYSTAMIFRAVIRAHVQIAAQLNSIGGNISIVGHTHSAAMHSLRSGKNVLVICAVVLILTVPSAISLIVISIEQEDHMPDWYKFAATWIFMSNYTSNSFLYLVLFRSVRKKTKEMFSELCQYC